MVRILALALCAVLFSFQAEAEDSKVAIGFVPAADFVPVMVAKDKEFFTRHGVDATLTIIPLISNIPAALVSGSLQIGATTGPIFLQAVQNGIDLVAICGTARWTPTSQTASLVVGKDSNIHTPQDLVGKRVAVPGLNSLMDLIFRRWLITKGVQPSSLTEVEASFPAMGDLLRNRQVAAAMVIEPFRDAVLTSGAGTRLADPAVDINPNILAAFYIADRSWAAAHPKDIAAFRAAVQEGMDDFAHDPADRAIEVKYLKVNAKVLPSYSTAIEVQDLQFHQDLLKQFGLLEGRQDLAKLILP